MNTTFENLAAAFAGESQANRKYLFFAEKADEEGHKKVARLFRAAAEAETVHARNHLRAMNGIKSTRENLEEALAGEHHEFTEMYPAFIAQAEADGDKKASRSFNLANPVEQTHHSLYGGALKSLDGTGAADDAPYFVCQVCGHTVEGAAPDKCPVCGAAAKAFKRVD